MEVFSRTESSCIIGWDVCHNLFNVFYLHSTPPITTVAPVPMSRFLPDRVTRLPPDLGPMRGSIRVISGF